MHSQRGAHVLPPEIPSALSQDGAHRVIAANYERFNHYLSRARISLRRKRYQAAATYSEIAAYSATWQHAGFFAHRELEETLLTIGRTAFAERQTPRTEEAKNSSPATVLHVATWVSGLQGLNRLLRRWIEYDGSRTHSVAVTGHGLAMVPQSLTEAVDRSKGRIHAVDVATGSALARADKLRRLAANADLVVLHLQTEDVLPLVALADRRCPTLFVNNADHAFWVGVSVTDLVVNLREAGRRLCHERRGVTDERNALLPTLIDPRRRTRSREAAKRELGLDPDAILLLSIARAPKFRTLDGVPYAEPHLPVLMRHKNVVLWIIGPTEDDDLRRASSETGGRVKAFGQRGDTELFYEAADVYVDSWPIVSITSLLEAGSYGVPLLSRFPYSEACGVLGADTPALDRCLTRAKTVDEYQRVLSDLVENPTMRATLGDQTRRAIEETHFPEGWRTALEDLYGHAARCNALPPNTPPLEHRTSELDAYIAKVYRPDQPIEHVVFSRYLKQFPLRDRVRIWSRLAVSNPYLVSPKAVTEVLARLGIKDSLRALLRRWEKGTRRPAG